MNARTKMDFQLMVVEDDDGLRELVKDTLTLSGYRVIAARGGEEAVGILKSQKVDLILSDMRMPEGDGMFLLKSIRSASPDVPILIFMTGYSDVSTEDCLKHGANRVLSKPCPRKEMVKAINEALGLEVAGTVAS